MNQELFHALYSLAHKNTFLDWIFIFLAHYLLYILVIVFAYMLFAFSGGQRRVYYFLLSILSLILSMGIISPILRYFIASPRPFVVLSEVSTLVSHPLSSSFPSNHMMFTVPIALTAYYLNKRWGKWFLIAVVLMGIARVIGGVHWPLDIIGGIAFGTAVFYAARYAFAYSGLNYSEEKV